jgi:hypothetical protein
MICIINLLLAMALAPFSALAGFEDNITQEIADKLRY